MAIIKDNIKNNYSQVYSIILHDKTLSLLDRGLLLTLINLPENWKLSISGLNDIVPDGTTAITNSLHRLEEKGYLKLTKIRNSQGKYETTLVFFVPTGQPTPEEHTDQKTYSTSDKPTWSNQVGFSKLDGLVEYKKKKDRNINKHDNHSIYLSSPTAERQNDGLQPSENETAAYRKLIADNIRLDWLLDAAQRSHDPAEISMVNETYETICDMVCFPRGTVNIMGTVYPWQVVKKQYLSLNHTHVSAVLNRIINPNLEIQNMRQYLISVLYNESLCGTIKAQSDLYDDYLLSYRGNLYAI